MGGGLPKPLLNLAGRSILARSVDTVLRSGLCQRIVVLAPAPLIDAYRTEAGAAVEVIPGGETRAASVRRGLQHLKQFLPPAGEALVLVHDAARCCVSADLLVRAVSAARTARAVTTAVPVVDTVLTVAPAGGIERFLDRSVLRAVQTPQVFTFSLLEAAHARAEGEATDDASLVQLLHPVTVIPGERSNLKVTTPEDLALAATLLRGEG